MTNSEHGPLANLASDELIDQLAHIDELVESAGNSDVATGSTVETLKADLDTLAAHICEPPAVTKYEEEPDLQRAFEAAASISRKQLLAPHPTIPSSHLKQPQIEQVGPYRLLAKIGEGGMGTVYKALHTRLRRVVAVKVLRAELMQNTDAIARFDREMHAVGRLDHPNIVHASDADQEGGIHYLVMEYIAGIDLAQLTYELGPLPVPDACELARQVAVGLQHAHAKGLVHRDVKPSNLMLAAREEAPPTIKILDMGLALLDSRYANLNGDLTSVNQMLGTLNYMAPEQVAATRHVDNRTDIYALGATLFTLLTGQPPFAGEEYDTPIKMLAALANEGTPSLSQRRDGLPPALVALVNSMLEKNPTRRPATSAEVAQQLAAYCDGCDLSALLERARAFQHARKENDRPDASDASDVIGAGSEFSAISDETPCTTIQLPIPVRQRNKLLEGVAENDVHPAKNTRRRTRGVAMGVVTVLIAMACIVFFSPGILFKVKTGSGLIVVEGDPDVLDNVDVIVDGEKTRFDFDGKVIQVSVDQRRGQLRIVTHGGEELYSNAFSFRAGQQRLPVRVSLDRVAPDSRAVPPDLPQQIAERPERVLLGHEGAVFALNFSPDGRYLASASADNTVRLWDAKTGAHLNTLRGHTSWVHSVSFRSDSRHLISASADKTVRIWNIEDIEPATGKPAGLGQTAKETKRFAGHQDFVYSATFSPDGTQALSSGKDHQVILWNAGTTEVIQKFEGHKQPVWSVAFAGNGRFALSAGSDNLMKMWNVDTGQEVHTFSQHTAQILSISAATEKPLAISAGLDGDVCVWNLQSLTLEAKLYGHAKGVRSVAVSPGGEYVLSGGMDQELLLWDVAKRQATYRMKGHPELIAAVALSPDNTMAASAGGTLNGSDRAIRLWRLPK